MNDTLKQSIILAGKIADLEATLCGLLNCKEKDTGKAIAALMEIDGLTTATVKHAGRTYSATYTAAKAGYDKVDPKAAKAALENAGLAVPMVHQAGAAATAKVK